MATISLGKYEKTTGVNKGTIQKCAQKLGFDTSQGLTDEAIAALESEYEMFNQTRKTTPQQPVATASQLVTYEPVNGGLAMPDMNSIVVSGDELLAQTWKDPMEIAELVVGMLEQKGGAEEMALSELRQRREDTRNATLILKAARAKASAQQQDRKIQSYVERARLEDAAAELSELTKGAVKQEVK